MPNSAKKDSTSNTLSVADDQQNKAIIVGAAKPLKEQEPASEAEVYDKIQEISKEADVVAEKEVRAAIGEEARLAQGEPKIGPDLEDHGVKSPAKEASEVLEKGSTIELPITEEEFREAEKAKIAAHVDDKQNVLGVGSIVALAMWVGRMIKMVHGKAVKVIFRKPSSAKATEGEGDGG